MIQGIIKDLRKAEDYKFNGEHEIYSYTLITERLEKLLSHD